MPPNSRAAAVTDAYRRRLITMRESTVQVAAVRLERVDFDGDLGSQLDEFVGQTTTLVESAQANAVNQAAAYMAAYMGAAEMAPRHERPDPQRHVGRADDGGSVEAAVDRARVGVLWRLTGRLARDVARDYGTAVAARVARSSVMAAARGAQADVMVEDPAVDGWARVASFGACGACLALSGRRSATSEAFDRHPACRCTAEPRLVGVPERVVRPDGQTQFDRMTEAQRAALFAGRGGEVMAKAVAANGVAALVSRTGRYITEAPLQTIT